jgi:hypothetical protein
MTGGDSSGRNLDVRLVSPAAHPSSAAERPGSSADANELHYADLSGDGLPDAVITIERRALDLTKHGDLPVLEEVTRVASGIGIDGLPTDEYARMRLVRVAE